MENTECATFHLNTCDILFGTTYYNSNSATDFIGGLSSQYGLINSDRNDFTFNNIDFKTILGTMYEKYDRFNLKLSCVMVSSSGGFGSTAEDRVLKINIAGLPFSNSGYRRIGNSNFTTVGSLTLQRDTPTFEYFNDDNVFTIYKPMPLNNIRIYFTKINDAKPTNVTLTLYPNIDFYFRIYGIKDK
jgi:hypothetical protein